MLPAYQDNPWSCILFMFYATMTIYILMSMMLAVISSNYSKFREQDIAQHSAYREKFLLERFNLYRNAYTDYMDRTGMYMFFLMINELAKEKTLIAFEDGQR